MPLGADMQAICSNIREAHTQRKKFLNNCFTSTHKCLHDANELIKNFHHQRAATTNHLRRTLHDFCSTLHENCANMLSGFETTRRKAFRDFMNPIREDISGLHQAYARFCAGHFEHNGEEKTTKKTKKTKK